MKLSELSRSIEGKVAIVTGAASGMGRATARLFADEGARVAALDINAGPLEVVVSEIEQAGCPVRGWTVDLDREPFIGQEALRAEKRAGSGWQFVGLVADWEELEALYEVHNLPPGVSASAWRTSVPIYRDRSGRKQVGYASSGTWSPVLKQNLAMAHVEAAYAAVGTTVQLEVTVEHERKCISAVVTERPFFDPPRKRSNG